MKISRFIKLRTLSHGPAELALERNHNPLRRDVLVTSPSTEFTETFLNQFKVPLDLERARKEPYDDPLSVYQAVAYHLF